MMITMTNWIELGNQQQMEWLVEYANRNLKYFRPSDKSFSDTETVGCILKAIEEHHRHNTDSINVQLGKMRNAWYQKKRRDERNSECYLSVSISNKAKGALKSLIKKSGKTQKDVIEELLINGSVTKTQSKKVSSDQLQNIMVQLEQLQQENLLIKERLAQVDSLNQQRWPNSPFSSNGEI